MRISAFSASLLVLMVCLGCGSKDAAPKPITFPPLGISQTIEPGIERYEVLLPRGDHPEKLWIYLPWQAQKKKVPCLFIGPAGSHMFDGNTLGDGDVPEHLPYVRAGYAVVAYEVDGELPPHPSNQQAEEAARAFQAADAGIANARAAIDYTLAKVPSVDPKHLYTTGHSSAASLSLLVAEYDPRIAACIAYAPCCNVPKTVGEELISVLALKLPDYRNFITLSSPNTHPEKLQVPLFLFHADDDSVESTADVSAFAAQVQQTNRRVTYVTVPSGEHYQSMIDQGIPQAIQWLQSLN